MTAKPNQSPALSLLGLPGRGKLLALGMALTVPLTSMPGAFAEDSSILNPLHWFHRKGTSQGKVVEQARRNAETAAKEAERFQQEADRAAQMAMHARDQAEKARQAADTLSVAAEEKKRSDAEWEAAHPSPKKVSKKHNKDQKNDQAANTETSATDTAKEPVEESSNNAALHLNPAPQGNQKAVSAAASPEIAQAPEAMDAQSQADAANRLTAPNALKDTLPGTNSEEALMQAEKARKEAKAAQEGKPAPKSNPWNPLGWFGGNASQEKPATEHNSPKNGKSDASPDSSPTATPNQNANASTEKPTALLSSAETSNTSTLTSQAPAEEKAPAGEKIPGNDISAEEGVAVLPNDTSAPQQKEDAQSKPLKKAKKSGAEKAGKAHAAQEQTAVIETERGNISIELLPEEAPKTVANFVKLVNEGFYSKYNMRFHRVIPGFVIQTGDPTGTGAGGSRETIPLEAKNKLSHNTKGVVAMARGVDPNSATSQFYITLAPQTKLDGKYAIFGKVVGGVDVLDKISKGDMLYGVKMADPESITRDPQEKKGLFSSMVKH